jgi:D-beta-D-heptose 7-phosphate kinase/D-beta-D-heptose 1-phosphate adenosyltransferase
VRIDDETIKPLTLAEEEKVLSVIEDLISETDLIILSDYAKGCLTRTLVSSIVERVWKEEIMILVDPKGVGFTKYNGATLLTPNFLEVVMAA